MREQVIQSLQVRTKDWGSFQSPFIDHIMSLYDEFVLDNLADSGFENNLMGDEEQYTQAVWEMQLAK